ncbi:MAG: hypothetical protein Q8P02_00155, partial [Candidatus Micrarchaeota archaeon]|nr:hypothetical protein [Candidatus Micrarchaeota archaeon]
ELFRAQGLDPASCLIDSQYIQGKVSYAAVLDKDITYGTPSSVVLGGNYVSPVDNRPTPELLSTRKAGSTDVPINQHLSGTAVSGYLNLNKEASGGGNLVVPEFYKDWITFTGKYTKADLYISLAASLVALGTVKDLRSAIKRKNDQVERVKGVREPSAITAKQIDEQLYGTIPQNAQGHFLLETPRTVAQGKQAYSVGIEEITENGQKTNVLKYYDKAGQEVQRTPGVANFDDILKKDPSLNFKRENGLTQDLRDADTNLERLRKIKEVSDARLVTSYMMAGGWLGPARLTFQDNAGIFFQIKNARDAHYLRLEANKKVLADFEDVSGILAMGKLQEFAARFVPLGVVPEKAFHPKSILLLNYPAPIKAAGAKVQTQDQTIFSTTSGLDSTTLFEITPAWSGNSFAENYEDIRLSAAQDYTSLAMVANGALPKPALYEDNLKRFTSLFSLAIPFMATRKLFELQESALGTGVFLLTLDFIDIDENIAKGEECKSEDVEEFKSKYRLAFAGSVATSFLNYGVLVGLFEKANILTNLVGGITTVTQWINPADLWRFYIGNNAIAYTSNCREQMFHILAYQKIPDVIQQPSNPVADKAPGLNDALSKIGLSNLLGATERDQQAEKELKNLKRVLDFRAQLTNQRGLIQTPELLYVHADDALLSIPSDLYGLVTKSCQNLRIQSPDGRSIDFSAGLNLYDKDGNLVAAFKDDAWKLRAMAHNRDTALSRVIIPNKIIQGTFSGNADTFLRVSSDGRSTLVNPSCNLAPALAELLGRPVGADLTQAIGKILRVQTTQGTASVVDGQLYYVGQNGFAKSVPAPQDVHNAIASAGALNVLNNGLVHLEGASAGGDGIGELVSVLGEHGALYYEPSTRRFSLIVYTLFQTTGQNLQDYRLTPKGKGVDINAQAKKGFEDSGNKLNAALDKIAGQDGITSFETKDHIYYITPDGKVLRVIDKNTGSATDYNITGPITTDGNGNIVVPTDKGPFTFALTNDNGQPTL